MPGSISESVHAHLRLRNDDLVAQHRILHDQIDGCVLLTDSEYQELARIGAKWGKLALAEMAPRPQADISLAWHCQFANQTVDTSTSQNPVLFHPLRS